MENKKHLTEQHSEHKQWLNELALAKDEVKQFEQQLSIVAMANNGSDIKAMIEHFQNQFIRQLEVIDELSHDIREAESKLTDAIMKNPVATDRKTAPDEKDLRSQAETFNYLFNELKKEYHQFLSKSL